MRRNMARATLETYKLKIEIFENDHPEELIALLNNLNKATKGTGTTMVTRWINYLRTMLQGEVLREFDEMASQNNGTKNSHLKETQEVLLVYSPPLKIILKHKHVMQTCTALVPNKISPEVNKSPLSMRLL